jgi:hypothetical protein
VDTPHDVMLGESCSHLCGDHTISAGDLHRVLP